MKNKIITTTGLLATTLTLLAFTACSKPERTEIADKTKEVYQDAKVAVTQSWADLKNYTFAKRSDFSAALNTHQKEFEADVSKLRANYAEAQASASRKTAMNELKNSEADYKEKLSAVGTATADTWDAARNNVIAAWDRLQVAYAKARAEK